MNGGPELTMTSQEAEAVLNLLNQRQQELESLRARTTVQDLAEATSVPTSEIEALLAHVRHSYTVPVAPQKKVRRHPFLIAFASLAGLALWGGILGGVFEAGMHKARNQQIQALLNSRGPFELSSRKLVVDKSPIAAENLPVGVSVTFDSGYTVDGEQKDKFYNEELLASSIEDVVSNRIEQRPQVDSHSPYNYEQEQKLPNALRTGNTQGFESYFAFEDLKVSVNGVELPVTKIPVERVRYGPGYDAIRQERERRIGLLANKMVRMLKEGVKG